MTPRRYTVLGLVGRGGFGAVYKAEVRGEGGFAKLVALKMLDPKMEDVDGVAARLRDEARILGLLRHRGVVRVDGLVRIAGRWTIVMELVDGADLLRIVRLGPVPVGPALEIGAEVAGVLHAAWSTVGPDGRALQLLHRDIKPSNIQLTRLGEVKLLDFGIARADFDHREAQTRTYAGGTEAYMSPERRDLIDVAAGDIYSLGVTLWEMLTGRRFGLSSGNRSRHEALVRTNLAALTALLGAGPTVELIREMVAYDPDQRPLAGEVERRCLLIRTGTADLPLRYWAERVVPAALAAAPPVRQGDDVEEGSSIAEDAEATTEREIESTAPPSRGWLRAIVALVVVFGAAISCAGAGGALLWWGAQEEPAVGEPVVDEGAAGATVAAAAAEPPPPIGVGEAPGAAEAPADTSIAEPRTGAAPDVGRARVEPVGATVRSDAQSLAPRAPASATPAGAPRALDVVTEAPVPTPGASPSTARVRATDGTPLRLCQGTCVSPDAVAAGTWSIEADFGQGFEPAGRIELRAGDDRALRCVAKFHLCSPAR